MKTALLLVDIQNDYFPGGKMELTGVEAAAAKAADLLNLFREKNWPVFFVQHIAAGENASFFLPDTNGVEIHASLQKGPGDVIIHKHFPNLQLRLLRCFHPDRAFPLLAFDRFWLLHTPI